MRRIVKTTNGWGLWRADGIERLAHPLRDILRGAPVSSTGEELDGRLVAPVDAQEIWAAGVTYKRSLEGRREESPDPDIYERVYLADRPEIFFKATAARVIGPDGVACIRSDSTWDVPEPEIGLVLDADGSIFGYTVGDDVSSRSIEGENPLYLPQAKVYEAACVLGPWIVPAEDIEAPFDITLRIVRGSDPVFNATTSTAKMARVFEDLASWLYRAMPFPDGAVLLTGTGIVPPEDVTLLDGDTVEIDVDRLGRLVHGVSTWTC